MARKKKRSNPGRGKDFNFHGAFKTKKAAMKRERAKKGRFIHPVSIKGHRRFLVMSPK